MRTHSFTLRLLIALAITFGGWFTTTNTPIAEAVPLTFAYEGIVDNTRGGPAFDAFLGETFRAQYTFESTTPGIESPPDNAAYPGAISSLLITVGANSYSLDPTNNVADIIVQNDGPGPPIDDSYRVIANILGPTVGGIAPDNFFLRFDDETATLLNSNALPLTPLTPLSNNLLDPFTITTTIMGIIFEGPIETSPFLTVDPETIKIVSTSGPPNAPIPEPSTMLLLGTGLLGLGIYRWKSGVRSKNEFSN